MKNIVRNIHNKNIIRKIISKNSKNFGSIHPSGFLDKDSCSDDLIWEKAPLLKWWLPAIIYYLRDVKYGIEYNINKNLGLIGREIPDRNLDFKYKRPNWFIDRTLLMFGIV